MVLAVSLMFKGGYVFAHLKLSQETEMPTYDVSYQEECDTSYLPLT
jgi:hypothetical protein